MTTAVRGVLLVAGLLLAAYGGVLLFDNPLIVLWRIGLWAAAGVVLHDFVFAPLCALLGWTGRRILPGSVRGPVGVAALCLIVIGLLAIPVYRRPGAHPDNVTVLDRNYPLGVLFAVGGVVSVLLCWLLAKRLLPVGQNQMVERQSADHIERQPPSV